PLPALSGTTPGMVKLPPPVVLQVLPAPHWSAVRLGLVQPMVSKPVVFTLLRTPATPTNAPKLPHVLLATTDAREPMESALLLSTPETEYARWAPSLSKARAL